jgi:hypothetical protein
LGGCRPFCPCSLITLGVPRLCRCRFASRHGSPGSLHHLSRPVPDGQHQPARARAPPRSEREHRSSRRSMEYWPRPSVRLGRSGRATLIKARNRSVLKRGSIRKVRNNFAYVTPTPMLGRIVPLNDRVRGGVKMLGRMPVRRVIATADVTAGPADTQVNPGRADLQTFLAASRTRSDVADRCKMRAGLGHATLVACGSYISPS